jgi:hypothetical protein
MAETLALEHGGRQTKTVFEVKYDYDYESNLSDSLL